MKQSEADRLSITLSVYFDGQFFVGIFERTENNSLSVARHIFGAEPKDSEVYDFVLSHFYDLRFSPQIEATDKEIKRSNPKTMQRKVKATLSKCAAGTKAQQAIKAQTEQRKMERKVFCKQRKEEEQALKFELRQIKKKEKHKGH